MQRRILCPSLRFMAADFISFLSKSRWNYAVFQVFSHHGANFRFTVWGWVGPPALEFCGFSQKRGRRSSTGGSAEVRSRPPPGLALSLLPRRPYRKRRRRPRRKGRGRSPRKASSGCRSRLGGCPRSTGRPCWRKRRSRSRRAGLQSSS